MSVQDSPAMDVPRDLTAHEVRVLGCLMEKEVTTPDNYPLTLNSLRHACNQSTSRDPVVDYADHEVEQALKTLRERGLTRTVHSTSNRATKYRHVAPEALGIDPAEAAVLSVLMLRGPQTVGEIKGRVERQHTFDSIDACQDVLHALAGRDEPLVVQLARQPGQKDARWVHLLAPMTDTAASAASASSTGGETASKRADDRYGDATAEFYDVLAGHVWEDFALQLLDLLDGVDVTVGPVVDVGAGTGIGLRALRDAVPGAAVWAIEPSPAMRTALHARLHDDPELRAAVTVVPSSFGEARLPSTACAVVACASFGHLSTGERQRLWRFVAEQMPAGAPAVIGVLPPDRPTQVEPVRYAAVAVGQFTYEGWQHAEPVDDRTMHWTMGYRVLDASGALVADYSTSAAWTCDSVEDIGAEIAGFGLSLTEHEGWVVVRRDASPAGN